MRKFKFLFATLSLAAFAGATSVERWTSSTVDTTTHHTNTKSSNGVGVGVNVTGTNGVGVGAKSTGYAGIGVKGEGTGSNGTGVKGIGPASGVEGYSVSGYGVFAQSDSSTGMIGTGYDIGVMGGGGPVGVHGHGNTYGVQGWSYTGTGVYGWGYGTGNGMLAVAQGPGYGLTSTSAEGTAISASGYNLGIDVSVTNLYANGINSYPGGRGTGYFTSGGQNGVAAYASSSDGYDNSYGVTGNSYGGDYSYGVTGYADGGTYDNWAGWFDGKVYVGGYLDNPSDQKFKKNVRDFSGGLAKILALKIKTYDMKVDEFKGSIRLPSGPQIGVIAQEAEKVFPELVHNTSAPARLTAEERKKGVQKKGIEFKSVNYEALIPVLVQAVQELQAEVDALKAGR